ncbi:MAG: short-chain dehydrogenase/reductase [Acidimicrobiia bacterium]|nr:short-chain dehydrogenase/reductase [Acidimicrobiia bacterium]
MEIRLDGRVAVVTGASKGIGAAIAAELAASGAKVMLSSRREDALRDAAATMPGDVAWFAANAGDPVAAQACIDATMERFGRVDILVNNAATNPYHGPLMGLDTERAHKTVQVNMVGPLVWTQAAWRAWMQDHGGAVLNIASIGGLRPGTSAIAWYGATKAGLIHLTQTLADELGPKVRVNAICPAVVKTDFAKALWEAQEEAVAATYPMKRLGLPGDVAPLAAFLVSDAASWITGGIYVVDGGVLTVSR